MCFNIVFHNRDDHVKNFSYVMDDDGRWKLSLAYDLCFSEGLGGEHFMTVMGEGRQIAREHILKLARETGISELLK
ncbi:MAG: hypothetical protein ACD_62C00643G0003 [uncultured bacterium]|nr:MAG: hypothetical protein ACD_62C00643G0003 [uncultured bacterium]HLD44972.1 HipA domain-containing protein [bacterium]